MTASTTSVSDAPGLIVLVCGSRDFPDPFRVALAIDERMASLPACSTVIHGAARGADQMAAEAAQRHGHSVREFPADWEAHGKRAGILRNLTMLDQNPDLVIAWWDGESRGTNHTITRAKLRQIRVEVYQF